MNIATTSTNQQSDLLGVFASGLCMIHCLATPLLFVAQVSAVRCSEVGPFWWRALDYLFLVVSIIAIHYSAKNTSLMWMPRAMYIAWGILAFLIINESLHVLPIPHAFMYLPALSLVVLHLYNRKYCRCDTEKCCETQQLT